MAKGTWTSCSLLIMLASATLCLADEKALDDAKAHYAKQAREARLRYVEIIEADAKRALSENNPRLYQKLQNHLAEVLLSRSDEVEVSAELDQGVRDANTELLQRIRQAKELLLAAYEQRLAELPATAIAEREALTGELALLKSGGQVPAVLGLPAAQQFTILKYVSEKKLVCPLASDLIPDEFDVQFSGQNFQISGTAQHDRARIQGQTCGHFGKVVLFDRRPATFWKQSGSLRIQTDQNDVGYSMVIVVGGKPQTTPIVLKVGKTYQWSAVISRRRLTFAVKDFEETIAEVQTPDVPGLQVGFLAQARSIGQKVDLTVGYEDISVVKGTAESQ